MNDLSYILETVILRRFHCILAYRQFRDPKQQHESQKNVIMPATCVPCGCDIQE